MDVSEISAFKRVDKEVRETPDGEDFALILERIDDDLPDEEKEEEPLIDGPVTGFAPKTPQIELSQAPLRIAPPKMIHEVVMLLKPELTAMSEKGILHMTVKVSSPLLKEIVLEIEQYDTAPSAFKITLSGNLEAQKLFAAQKQLLEAGLIRALPGMTCTILPPVYPTRRWSSKSDAKNSLVKSKTFGYGANEKEGLIQ